MLDSAPGRLPAWVRRGLVAGIQRTVSRPVSGLSATPALVAGEASVRSPASVPRACLKREAPHCSLAAGLTADDSKDSRQQLPDCVLGSSNRYVFNELMLQLHAAVHGGKKEIPRHCPFSQPVSDHIPGVDPNQGGDDTLG